MKILVIDTSGPVCGVAVMDENRVYSEFTAQNKMTHSASLMPMTEQALIAAGMELSDLDAIAAVAKGLAHGAGIPCIPVDALEALSDSAGFFEGIICPIQDARAGQVYGAAFSAGQRLMADMPMKMEEYLDRVSSMGDRFLFLGDGAPVFESRIREIMGDRAMFAPAHLRFLRPSAAGLAALRNGKTVDYLHLEATYLRPPNAQKNRKLMEAMKRQEDGLPL